MEGTIVERQTLLYSESDGYKITRDRFGNYTLTRKSDGKSLYFQGDDALVIEEEVTHPQFKLDEWASNYDACIQSWEKATW